MHLIYYLPNDSCVITCLDYVNTLDGAKSILEDLAIAMVLKDCGEKRSSEAFKYSIEDLSIYNTPDGLHLMRVESDNKGFIEVYKKSTKLVQGMLYGLTPVVTKEKIGTFCISEMKNFKRTSNVEHIIKATSKEVNVPSLPFVYIEELKGKLLKHKSKSYEEIEEFLEKNKKIKEDIKNN